MFGNALAVIVITSSVIQLGYCIFFFRAFLNQPGNANNTNTDNNFKSAADAISISIIICAHNEAQNLRAHLPAILDQHYANKSGQPAFEVIVVNDRSDDDSDHVLQTLQNSNAALKTITISPETPRIFPGKKDALSRGVAAAAHDIILMTDADCRPASHDWIARMTAPFAHGKKIVAGFGDYERKSGMLNRVIRCETLHTFVQYFAYNFAGIPYMAVGRNLAVKKELLIRAQQSDLWKMTASGDDDLLIRLCATSDNMAVLTHPDSQTMSAPKTAWRDWLTQKQRHLSTGKLYSGTVKLLLGTYAFSHAVFWLCLALIFIFPAEKLLYPAALSIAFLRLVAWAMLFSFVENKLRSTRSFPFFSWLIFDPFWLLYNIILSPYIFWKSKQKWT